MNSDDIFVWPCGTCCYREELEEFSHKSDDYLVIPFDAFEWYPVALEMEGE